jgi:hypothetical protein
MFESKFSRKLFFLISSFLVQRMIYSYMITKRKTSWLCRWEEEFLSFKISLYKWPFKTFFISFIYFLFYMSFALSHSFTWWKTLNSKLLDDKEIKNVEDEEKASHILKSVYAIASNNSIFSSSNNNFQQPNVYEWVKFSLYFLFFE